MRRPALNIIGDDQHKAGADIETACCRTLQPVLSPGHGVSSVLAVSPDNIPPGDVGSPDVLKRRERGSGLSDSVDL